MVYQKRFDMQMVFGYANGFPKTLWYANGFWICKWFSNHVTEATFLWSSVFLTKQDLHQEPYTQTSACSRRRQSCDCAECFYQAPNTFSKSIFHALSIVHEKTVIPSLSFIFTNFQLWTQRKTSAKLSSAVKKQNLNKFVISIRFQYSMYNFGQIQHFFKVLKTAFTIQSFSVLSILRGKPE